MGSDGGATQSAEADRKAPLARTITSAQVTAAITSFTAIAALIFTGLSVQQGRQQLELSQQGQLTDRYTHAVDQLGSEKVDVRLGGIFSLERMARDSSRDLVPIRDLLATYVREHFPVKNRGDDVAVPARPSASPSDLEAAVTVLARLPRSGRSGLNLSGVDMSGITLVDVDLHGYALQGTQFNYASLQDVNFNSANMDQSSLYSVEAYRTSFRRARLFAVNFSRATLNYVDVSQGTLTLSDWFGSNVFDLVAHQANLENALFNEAIIVGADFSQARLDDGALNTTESSYNLGGCAIQVCGRQPHVQLPTSTPEPPQF